jgi:putative SOS response-associated peptidase YedK
MCGRFSLTVDLDTLQAWLGTDVDGVDHKPRYNIAPSQQVAVVYDDGTRIKGEHMRWGLIPSWASNARMGYRMINARAETVRQKPAFRGAFRKRRCLIPADGFYEWENIGKHRRPFRFVLRSGGIFAFAGLWERWTTGGGEEIRSCTIITTRANSLVGRIHDRMPVILEQEVYEEWLDPENKDAVWLRDCLVPYPTGEMVAHEVSSSVNSPNHDSPRCVAPLKNGVEFPTL